TLNKFCAVGDSGTITTLTAAFAASTTQTSGTTANLKGVASNGAGTYCTVGSTGAIGTSTNAGVTWTWQDCMTNGIGSPSLNFVSIIWDGTYFVISDDTGLIAHSANGLTWVVDG